MKWNELVIRYFIKWKKLIYLGLIILLAAPIIILYSGFNGNPVSKYFSTITLKSYLNKTYPDHEFDVSSGEYNFKNSGYDYEVRQIGDKSSKVYDFTVEGVFIPKVVHDGIYYANLDRPLMNKLSSEAETELTKLLNRKIAPIKRLDVELEILKGKYPLETNWGLDINLEKPLYIYVQTDATHQSKSEFFEDAKTIQQTLKASNYIYDYVIVNGNYFGEDIDPLGFVKYSIGFDKDTKLKMKKIEEPNKESFID